MSKPTKWACGICHTEFATQAEADACEAVPLQTPVVKVGDIVLCRGGFGWYDGDRKWISNADRIDPKRTGTGRNSVGRRERCPKGDGNCFGDCCCFAFYYVVTHIDHEELGHRARYFLETMAMTGAQGYRGGWTASPGHHEPKLVKRPPRYVMKTSRALVGHAIPHLL